MPEGRRGAGHVARLAHHGGEEDERGSGGLGGDRGAGVGRGPLAVAGGPGQLSRLEEQGGARPGRLQLGAGGQRRGPGEGGLGEQGLEQLEGLGVGRRWPGVDHRLEERTQAVRRSTRPEGAGRLDAERGAGAVGRELGDERLQGAGEGRGIGPLPVELRERAERRDVGGLGPDGGLERCELALAITAVAGQGGRLEEQRGGAAPSRRTGRPLEEGLQLLVPSGGAEPGERAVDHRGLGGAELGQG